ncbi:MAG: tetratricopeptide repeat protein [Candidatus Thiodiazotropha lotti]|uniref:Tetratricopeptide repeat protein n=1 Tax=Candidatus Thiodiazotropha lotti TaxID=2792787 RepID=A0A9E4N1G1_9GAMM|nr:tetratricopeptide repeat protein [Candidatus Thiodiazotropha lotti]MCG7923452.1 tetratricopeptide repeat protein [Candidatus Thiodiazotropha lotti]MCG7931254.1 tetratricopeptide repeat protein [Candidatus Thiodiazotropha lotti]MCG7939755.1 tetratricopeptide repeat protein [Candidatus Thiodiazotropha lotti]MCG8005171.1 tetratricopeptide repeat protein [Candidatus Thiodiazotropha lotti]
MRSINTQLTALGLILLTVGCSSMTTPQQQQSDEGNNTSVAATAQPSESKDPQLTKSLQSVHRLYKKNKLEQAKQELQALIEEYPTQTAPHIDLGIIQLDEQAPQAAEQSFNAALAIDAESSTAHNLLGIALRMQGKFKQAEQAYQAALTHQPDYLLAHRNLGILYDLYLAKPKQALQHYQQYQTMLGSKDKEMENWIIDLQRRVGK